MSFNQPGFFSLKNVYRNFAPRKMTRVWCFAMAFLLLAQIFLPVTVDFYYRHRSGYFVPEQRLPHNFMLIYKDFPSTLDYIRKHGKEYDFNIVVIGDSVMYGAGVGASQTVAGYLQQELERLLPGRSVRVWNLAIPGSEPGDMYFALRRIEQLQPDAVVADLNMLFYGPASIKDPLAFNWLYLDEGLPKDALAQLNSIYPRSVEDRAADFLASHWAIYRYRDLFNAILFKKHPRDKLDEIMNTVNGRLGLKKEPAVPPSPEQQRKQKLAQIAFMYQSEPIDENTNPAYGFTRAALERLESLGMPALVVLTAQNEEMLGKMVNNPVFRANVDKVRSLIKSYDVTCVDVYGRIPGDLFVDHVHLNPEGNKLLAREIAGQLAGQLEARAK
jgi:hypothetical protein